MSTTPHTRTFEYKDAKSAKFWEVTTDGTTVTVRYGKIGTNGQSQTKVLADAAAAANHVAKLVAEKTGKGYVESGQSAGSLVASEAVPEVTPAALRKKAVPAKKTASTNPAKDPDASPESLLALLNKDDTTNRLLARHPRASADLLEKLSHSSDKATRQGVAANPNTPPETYVKLGQQFPKEFLANPALDLLLMLNPALMEEVPEALLVRLLKQADCPASLLTWAAGTKNSKVQLAVAMNANAPESARQLLGQSLYSAVREAVKPMAEAGPEQEPEQAFVQALRERIGSLGPNELREAWNSGDIGLAQWSALPLTFRLAQATNSEEFAPACIARLLRDSGRTLAEIRALLPHDTKWEEVAKHPFTPEHVLVELSKGSDYSAKIGVAKNHSTPVAVLEALALAKDSNEEILHGIAVNPSTPKKLKVRLLEGLLVGNPFFGPYKVARNPATPASVLENLSKLSDSRLRCVVAENPATSVPVLETLSKSADKFVRGAVSSNPSVPVSVLEILSKDSEYTVRREVARNPSAPLPVLEALAKDSEQEVRSAVARTPSAPLPVLEALVKDSEHEVRAAVASNPLTPVPLLAALSKDPDSWVRLGVSANPSTPVLVLEALAEDADSDVRRAVAENPSRDPTVLEKLTTDRDSFVNKTAISNPNTPLPALIKQISSKAVGVRRALASQSHRSPEILYSLWKDTHDSVRQAVAACPDLTQAQLDEMLQGCELETDLVPLLVHPNLSVKSAECIFDKLFTTPAADSAWYRRQLAEASAEIRSAAQADNVTFYHGKDPNKAVLAKRALAPLMALCAGPFIEPARLVKVVGSTDWLVRAAVARNQGTPPNLIKKLSADAHPLVAELTKKPTNMEGVSAEKKTSSYSFNQDRVIKEICARFQKLPPYAKAVDDVVWGKLARVSDVWHEDGNFIDYLKKELTEGEWINLWTLRAKLKSPEDRKNVAKSSSAPEFVLEMLAKDKSWSVRQGVAENPNAPLNVLEILSKDKNDRVRQVVACNPNCPSKILEELANDNYWFVRSEVARNPRVSLDVLDKMDNDKDGGRTGVAGNPITPLAMLEKISNDKSPYVRCEIASNPSITPDILKKLANDKDEDVRIAVAGNTSTPSDILEFLINDKNLHVRWELAGNPRCTSSILEALSNDKAENVRWSVAKNPSSSSTTLEKMANEKDVKFRRAVAENPRTPFGILEKLSNDEDDYLRLRMAENPRTPIAILEILANDKYSRVRCNVAKNVHTPSRILEQLAIDEDVIVRGAVAGVTTTSPELLEVLAQDKAAFVRMSVAKNPCAPNSVLQALAQDKTTSVREAVAMNPFTPRTTLETLSKDRDGWVRNSAVLNPMSNAFALGVPIFESSKSENNIEFSKDEISFSLNNFIHKNYQRLHVLRRAMEMEPILSKGNIPDFNEVDEQDIFRGFVRVGILPRDPDNKLLTKASRSKDWLSRLGVALQPEATKAQLKLLCEDADPDVAAAARQRLQNAP